MAEFVSDKELKLRSRVQRNITAFNRRMNAIGVRLVEGGSPTWVEIANMNEKYFHSASDDLTEFITNLMAKDEITREAILKEFRHILVGMCRYMEKKAGVKKKRRRRFGYGELKTKLREYAKNEHLLPGQTVTSTKIAKQDDILRKSDSKRQLGALELL